MRTLTPVRLPVCLIWFGKELNKHAMFQQEEILKTIGFGLGFVKFSLVFKQQSKITHPVPSQLHFSISCVVGGTDFEHHNVRLECPFGSFFECFHMGVVEQKHNKVIKPSLKQSKLTAQTLQHASHAFETSVSLSGLGNA